MNHFPLKREDDFIDSILPATFAWVVIEYPVNGIICYKYGSEMSIVYTYAREKEIDQFVLK